MMDETILFPSPNWFQVSGLAVSSDGWLFYGGPSKSLCVLEPLDPDFEGVIADHKRYRAHVLQKAHAEKICCVDICPEWPEKRWILTGAINGSVKQWTIDKANNTVTMKSSHTHPIHCNDREEVAGVCYCTNTCAITVGSYGNIVKWDLSSNIYRTYNSLLSRFRPTCIACSPHRAFHVAIGTKQGVVFLVDLSDTGKTLYKVRGHDEEVLCVSWCPQNHVDVKKYLKVSTRKKDSAIERMEKIRQVEEPEPDDLDESAVSKMLPEDSFDETIVEEDDMFDIYQDHEEDEFGHKKYKPELISVKISDTEMEDFDYLLECEKLKDDILKKKNEPEPSISSLVDELENTHVDDDSPSDEIPQTPKENEKTVEYAIVPQKHLLASIGKHGNLRIWSNQGKLMASCAVHTSKLPKVKSPTWCTILWYKPEVLIIADGKNQILECNPLETDCKNKLDYNEVHAHHRRGVYCIASNAPRCQPPVEHRAGQPAAPGREWVVWSVAQDRSLVCYSMEDRKLLATYNTCGGFLYNIAPCPYDANRFAVSVGDGAVRVWDTEISETDENKLSIGEITSYWQNVQGKVLSLAWHPTKENILAFGTAEARVGIIDTMGKQEKPARVLPFGLRGGVYSLCWGDKGELYASGGGDLIMYRMDKKQSEPVLLDVKLEGMKWEVSALCWSPAGLLCGSTAGAVSLLAGNHLVAVTFLFNKMIHSMTWHPEQTSNSIEESPYKNVVAVSSLDKSCSVTLAKYSRKQDGSNQLLTWKSMFGHKLPVLHLAWNPHIDGHLLSSSQDGTVRVWEIENGTCVGLFSCSAGSSLGVAWSAYPQHADVALTGGADCCLRLWRVAHHPPRRALELLTDLGKKKKNKKIKEKKIVEEVDEAVEGQMADRILSNTKNKASKRYLLSIASQEMTELKVPVLRMLAQSKLSKISVDPESANIKLFDESEDTDTVYDTTFLKMFGSANDVNELLDLESQYHLEAKEYEAWVMLSLFRGHIDLMFQFASEHNMLCPFLVSLSPCVSFKYWKDVTQMYLAQINKNLAQQKDEKLSESREFGGALLRKVAMMLSVHDVKGAVRTLADARLFKEAYILCRTRHMDSIADETLKQWVNDSILNGCMRQAILCYIAAGEFYQACTIIAKMKDEELLSFAVDLAKVVGQHTYADHLAEKLEQLKLTLRNEEVGETLEQLPSRMELLLKIQIGENETEGEKIEDEE